MARRHLAALIVAAALLLKLLVPAGYMIGRDHGRVVVTLCPGTMLAPMTATMAMPAMHGAMADHGQKDRAGKHGGDQRNGDHGRAEMPCAFAGLSAAATGAIDPVQLAALVAFVMAIGLAVLSLPLPLAPPYLRPPLRGPPACP